MRCSWMYLPQIVFVDVLWEEENILIPQLFKITAVGYSVK